MMSTDTTFEHQLELVGGGERLPVETLRTLEAAADILPLGMLADAARRRRRGGDVTYLRVAAWDGEAPPAELPPAAREVRLAGAPATLEAAVAAVTRARELAGERAVAGFAWADVTRLAGAAGATPAAVLRELRGAGLDAVARVALDMEGGAREALEQLADAGFQRLRVGVEGEARVEVFVALAAFQDAAACVQAVNPLPYRAGAARPTTGYQDVRAVALARLAAPNVPTVQVDWQRYGPKLAQVALTFGADDLDMVSASDEAPDGRRRAAVEEVRRNVEAAGLIANERDGYFTVVA